MILFSFSNCLHIGRELQAIPLLCLGQFAVARYDNQELHAFVQGPVSGEHCLILGSISPPDEQMLSLMLLAHTLKKGRIRSRLSFRTLPIADRTKISPEKAWQPPGLGPFLEASESMRYLLSTCTANAANNYSPCRCSLSTADLFAAALKKHQLTAATIVAPDNGAISRCEAVKSAAGMPIGDTPYFEKKRTEKGIIHLGLIGNVGSRVVLIDDMLDTGGTLISACEQLRTAKVEEIYILVSHGLFTGTGWTKLWSHGVKHIFCTDTVPLRAGIEITNITVLSVVPLLRECLSSMDGETRS